MRIIISDERTPLILLGIVDRAELSRLVLLKGYMYLESFTNRASEFWLTSEELLRLIIDSPLINKIATLWLCGECDLAVLNEGITTRNGLMSRSLSYSSYDSTTLTSSEDNGEGDWNLLERDLHLERLIAKALLYLLLASIARDDLSIYTPLINLIPLTRSSGKYNVRALIELRSRVKGGA